MGHLISHPYLWDQQDLQVVLFAVESIDYISMRWGEGLLGQEMCLQIYHFEYYNLMAYHPSLPLQMSQICHCKEFFLLYDLESQPAKEFVLLIPSEAVIQA